jgi:protein-S-isoprenylcysteine O-methyltransferase Ste14
MVLWRQVKSFARPVVVLGVIPFIITWLSGVRWSQATADSVGWLWVIRFRVGVGSGVPQSVTRALGWMLLAVGLLFFWWAVGTFIRRGQTLAPEDKPDRLVTSGPFRYCTHPMFFGVLCVSYAEGFLLTPWVFVFTVVFQVWLLCWYLPYQEEPALRYRFGDDWLYYSSRTFRGVLPIGLVNARYRYRGRPLPVSGVM